MTGTPLFYQRTKFDKRGGRARWSAGQRLVRTRQEWTCGGLYRAPGQNTRGVDMWRLTLVRLLEDVVAAPGQNTPWGGHVAAYAM